MLTKKSICVGVIAIMFSIYALFCGSCSLFGRKIKDELPQENITSVERITVDVTNGEETSVALSSDRIDTFMSIVNGLEYVKYYNIRGVKCTPFDEVYYVITYETYKVELSENRITLYKDGEWQKQIRFAGIVSLNKYNQISALFEE